MNRQLLVYREQPSLYTNIETSHDVRHHDKQGKAAEDLIKPQVDYCCEITVKSNPTRRL